MGLEFSFQPSRELRRKLQQLTDQAVRARVAEAINDALDNAVELVRGSTPEGDSGQLRSSIQVFEYAAPDKLSGVIGSDDPVAPYVEFGTGIYNEQPGAPRQPFVVKAKNWRKVYFTSPMGIHTSKNVKMLTFYSALLGHFISKEQVTIQGQKPAAMFRGNIHKIRRRLGDRIRRALADLK